MSTEQHTIKSLLADKKIIIPDVQRDYCWGAEIIESFLKSLLDGKEESLMLGMIFGYGGDTIYLTDGQQRLVESFLKSLLDGKEKSLMLGMIFGYGGDTIYLTDGQQRLTTLFLIFGVMNRKRGDNSLKKIVQNDAGEPRLLYAIRDTSMFFMSDLVDKYFCNPATTRKIKEESWYVHDYNYDPSVQSMMRAIDIIEKHLESKSIGELSKLSEFLLEKVELIYYCMETQQMSEEAYVVINTTGEPLTAAENYKPHYVSTYEGSATRWEEIVQFFWLNRNDKATADEGMQEFLIWAQSIHEVKITDKVEVDKLCSIKPEDLCKIFNSMKAVFASELALDKAYLSRQNSSSVRKQIIPLIAYHLKFGDVNLKRAWMFFENHIHHEQKNENLLLAVNGMKDADIISITTDILSDEEKYKFSLYRESPQRERLEANCWHAERMKLWGGRIMPLLHWAKDSQGQFSFDALQKLRQVLDIHFRNDSNEDSRDELRRALLANEATNCIFGRSGWIDMADSWMVWREKLSSETHQAGLARFFYSLLEVSLQDIINKVDKEDEFYPVIANGYALSLSTYKKIDHLSMRNYNVIRLKRAYTGIHIKLITLHQEINKELPANWQIWWYHPKGENAVLVIENKSDDIVLYIAFNGHNTEPRFTHALFKRNNGREKIQLSTDVYGFTLTDHATIEEITKFVKWLINA